MIRLSKLADYGVVILAALAEHPTLQVTAAQISEKTLLPTPTVSKLLKKLAKSGHVAATRGATGGYRLSALPHEITAASIVEAIDGPVRIVSCAGPNARACARNVRCTIKGNWDPINDAILQALTHVKLADLVSPAAGTQDDSCKCVSHSQSCHDTPRHNCHGE